VKGTRSTGHWTHEEDAKLNSAVTNNRKKKRGKEYKIDWVTVAALFPDRTKKDCQNRWYRFLDPSIDRVIERRCKWTEDEDSKLKDAVHTR
jgi:hypothetical protein